MSSYSCMPSLMAAIEYLPKNQTIMEKERKITAPEGCEIEKVELVDGVAVVTFKEKERKLPKSWEQFCEMFPCSEKEYFISSLSQIVQRIEDESCSNKRHNETDMCTLPDHATAEAVFVLCQLIQLRNCYNGDWVPNWGDYFQDKYTIEFHGNEIFCDTVTRNSTILYFKSDDLCDEFLRNFRPLIEKLEPLYGIKEGGEE